MHLMNKTVRPSGMLHEINAHLSSGFDVEAGGDKRQHVNINLSDPSCTSLMAAVAKALSSPEPLRWSYQLAPLRDYQLATLRPTSSYLFGWMAISSCSKNLSAVNDTAGQAGQS
jgi:hypothetical protein